MYRNHSGFTLWLKLSLLYFNGICLQRHFYGICLNIASLALCSVAALYDLVNLVNHLSNLNVLLKFTLAYVLGTLFNLQK